MRVLSLSGSLRRASHNTAALRAAQELAPPGVTIEIASLHGIPLYDDDLRQAGGYPEPVERLRGQIRDADAVLFACPEYNFSVSGVLKNAIDWVSRPPAQPFDGKPVAILGAAGGLLGTARAQYHLRQMLVFLNAHPLNKPEVFIGQAGTKFDAEGRLTDAATREHIAKQLVALQAWARRLGAVSG